MTVTMAFPTSTNDWLWPTLSWKLCVTGFWPGALIVYVPALRMGPLPVLTIEKVAERSTLQRTPRSITGSIKGSVGV